MCELRPYKSCNGFYSDLRPINRRFLYPCNVYRFLLCPRITGQTVATENVICRLWRDRTIRSRWISKYFLWESQPQFWSQQLSVVCQEPPMRTLPPQSCVHCSWSTGSTVGRKDPFEYFLKHILESQGSQLRRGTTHPNTLFEKQSISVVSFSESF